MQNRTFLEESRLLGCCAVWVKNLRFGGNPTRRHIPEYGIFHSHRRENLKYYRTFLAPTGNRNLPPLSSTSSTVVIPSELSRLPQEQQ
jgi:hypothetical protein